MKVLFFYKEHPVLGCLSNFSPHPIDLCGKVFPTSEHLFQAWKFIRTAPEWSERIRLAATPTQAKYLGRSRSHPIMSTWNEERVEIMLIILRDKASQHKDVRRILLATNTCELIEKAPWDNFWGSGKDGKGENMLGKLWMVVRTELRQAQ